MKKFLFLCLVCLIPAVVQAQSVVNEDFEDGQYGGFLVGSCKVPPAIRTEDSNSYLRITGTAGDGGFSGALDDRLRCTWNFTATHKSMPLISASNMRQTYSADLRVNTPCTYCSIFEFFQAATTCDSTYGSHDGCGPSARFIIRNGRHYFETRLNNETDVDQYDLGLLNNAWHNFKLVAVWSHDPDVGRLEAYVDGVKKVTVSGRDVNTGPDTNRLPAVKIGPYGDFATGTVDVDDVHINPTGGTSAPTINTFSANPTAVTSGNASTLTCDATNAANGCIINQNVGTCCTSASTCETGANKSTGPLTATKTFTLTCSNGPVSSTATRTVQVNPIGPNIVEFRADPLTIPPGGSTTLHWEATNATTCSIDQGIGQICAGQVCADGGTTVRSPTVNTTYTMTCSNAQGSETDQETVTVGTPPPASSIRYVAQTDQGTGDCSSAANACDFTQGTTNLGPGSTLRVVGTVTASCDNCLPAGISAAQPTVLESATTGSVVQVGTNKTATTPGAATLQASTATVLRLASPAQWVVVRRLNITTTGASTNSAVLVDAPDITFEDVEIQAPTRTGTNKACLETLINAARFRGDRLRVHRCGPPVNLGNMAPTFHGVRLQGADILLQDSDVWDNSGDGVQINEPGAESTLNNRSQVRRVRSFGNGGMGFVIGNGTDQLLSQNLSYENGSRGYRFTNTARRLVAHGNVAHANSRQTGSAFAGISLNTNVTGIIRNNISIGHPVAEYDILPSGSAIACSDNLSSDASETATCAGTDLNAVAANIWVDSANATLATRDYSLKPGSAAIDQGTSEICTTADVSASRCTPALTLSTFQSVAPDQGAYEAAALVLPQTVSRYLFNNTVADDVGPNEGIPVGITFDATNKIEGSHSALFDAVNDAIEIPLAGFTRRAFTIALSARATVFGGSLPRYMFGHTSDYEDGTYRDRIQIYLNPNGTLAIGLGGSHTTIPSAYPFELNTFERVVLVVQEGSVSGSGTAQLYVRGGLRATAIYSGLTQIGPYAHIGNNGAAFVQGWFGQIDALKIDNYAWSSADVTDDCATYCTPVVEPFDPIAPTNCTLGQVAANVIECDAVGQPDPDACDVLTDFSALYDEVEQAATACTLTGSNPAHLTVTVAASATPTTVVKLVYEPQDPGEYTVENLLGPQTFVPLEVRNCATDASGIIVTCDTIGSADPGLCQTLSNFRVTENCVPVNVTGCAISSSTLSLERSQQPVSATIPMALELQQEVQVIAITNNFVPGTPPAELP